MMPIGKRRTKLVSFRLSEEEYEELQATCIGEGARSMSEFARALLRQRMISQQPKTRVAEIGSTLELTTQELVETTRELTLLLTRLVSQIRARSTDLSS
jgi:hypothetical protein